MHGESSQKPMQYCRLCQVTSQRHQFFSPQSLRPPRSCPSLVTRHPSGLGLPGISNQPAIPSSPSSPQVVGGDPSYFFIIPAVLNQPSIFLPQSACPTHPTPPTKLHQQ
jgi:hypothetical protein